MKVYTARKTIKPGKKTAKGMHYVLAVAAVLAAATVWRMLYRPQQPVQPHLQRPAQRITVAVDSGHGGADTGAKGLVNETQVTQATAAALLALLQADGNFAPVQVHTDEECPTPQQRAAIAQQTGAQLFLSLHANKDTSSASYGFECYAVPPGHTQHEESLLFARTVCARMAAAGARLRGEDGVRYAYYRRGAKIMKESSDSREYDLPTFGVLQQASCPAVLIEQCFISNAQDLAQWGSAGGCAAAAYCYYQAICDYFGTEPLPAP